MENNNVIRELAGVIASRREHPEEGSYTCYLFEKGLDKILKKCGEECTEMVIAAKNADDTELAGEIADLVYHVLVMMQQRGIPVEAVEEILAQRSKKIGNLKQFHQVDRNS